MLRLMQFFLEALKSDPQADSHEMRHDIVTLEVEVLKVWGEVTLTSAV
jgi:hypothetical protein